MASNQKPSSYHTTTPTLGSSESDSVIKVGTKQKHQQFKKANKLKSDADHSKKSKMKLSKKAQQVKTIATIPQNTLILDKSKSSSVLLEEVEDDSDVPSQTLSSSSDSEVNARNNKQKGNQKACQRAKEKAQAVQKKVLVLREKAGSDTDDDLAGSIKAPNVNTGMKDGTITTAFQQDGYQTTPTTVHDVELGTKEGITDLIQLFRFKWGKVF
ncbi:hypothetical protein BS47DRAFT_1357119 [Hydnum rufescens UP504]|uniref:Uncharacterized protein n=1 Tax=Hydnum rufescens UP504 TaxID=1448309 RepID=A0A9P6BBR0_9AGAM|nr:hypothetical protein BS47DRAFT_1357119 [Hydnum rufescens UP504]